MTSLVTATRVKKCVVSHKQNLLRLKGFNFIYHMRASSKTGAFLNRTVCGKSFRIQLITYTELHNASGMARMCIDCRESVL